MNHILRLAILLVVLAAAPVAGAAEPTTAEAEAAVRADPVAPGARVKLGKAYFKDGRYKDAAKQWNRVLVTRGETLKVADRAKLNRIIALALHKAGDEATAQKYIERARKDAPTDALVLKVAGMIAPVAVARPAVTAPPSEKSPAAPGAGDGQELPIGFLRVGQSGAKHALQTGRATMVSPDGKVTVYLDGMCHMGEAQYYKNVQDSLVPHDVVLFEAVTLRPGDTKDLGKPNPMDPAQNTAVGLGLVAQTMTIDYKRPNFVWADITLGELMAYEKSPGFQQAVSGVKAEAPPMPSDDDLKESELRDLSVPRRGGPAALPADRQRELRAKMARALQTNGGDLTTMGAPKAFSELLIFRRNDYVMRGITEQIAQGKKTISVLYGAAHMPDISKRLECMGYKMTKLEWRDVWTF